MSFNWWKKSTESNKQAEPFPKKSVDKFIKGLEENIKIQERSANSVVYQELYRQRQQAYQEMLKRQIMEDLHYGTFFEEEEQRILIEVIP